MKLVRTNVVANQAINVKVEFVNVKEIVLAVLQMLIVPKIRLQARQFVIPIQADVHAHLIK